ncbi:hypothetical protein [Patiriisocius marinus]|uniref:Uncharacterized protein n=1 Tax=Patiriisocius marinus TaxID=1397112 RepID=A0A5J4J092_9FLAO|nr:hypothetical protein [Patiriisocius marinus]GER60222.1 hypothetical protein ULMA_23300 [Patiriisocius marinus]
MKHIFVLIFTLLSVHSYSQNRSCIDFKTGEFRYLKEGRKEKIIRKENLQIETNPYDNIIIKTSIDWTSECNYTMTYIEILNHTQDVSSVIGKKINCEIIETNGNNFTVHAKSDVMDEILNFIKVN